MYTKGTFTENGSQTARCSTATASLPTTRYRTRRGTMSDCKMTDCSTTSTADLSTDRSSAHLVKPRFPIFKNEYEIIKSLGNGNTAKVYLARHRADPTKKIALKILRDEFLKGNNNTNTQLVEQEIQILSALNHENIVRLVDYGSDG